MEREGRVGDFVYVNRERDILLFAKGMGREQLNGGEDL